MIRINLLGGERQVKKRAIVFDVGQRLTILCSLLLVLTVAGIGYWYWTLNQASTQVDADIAAAQQEQQRLQSIIREVAGFDEQRAQLQQRVALIEQLRSGQSIPVQLLDHLSKSMPDMLWLTDLQQQGTDVTIQGQSTTLISLSDFVGNLGGSPLLKKPIEIVNSQVETVASTGRVRGAGIDLIKFTVKAQLSAVPEATPTSPAARGRGAAAGRAGAAGRGAGPAGRAGGAAK
jgi:type IV pilus assembly protein PilN